MCGVWDELTRSAADGGFLHSERGASAADAIERQSAAMVEVFNTAFACRKQRWITMTQGEIEQQCRRYSARAEQLRDDAETMVAEPLLCRGMASLTPEQRNKCFQELNRAADIYDAYALGLFIMAQRFLLKREHDIPGRQVALTVSDMFRRLFGSPMYSTTAKLVSVILDRKINPRRVQQWCTSDPAVKLEKVGP
jgi:hypothetical protein